MNHEVTNQMNSHLHSHASYLYFSVAFPKEDIDNMILLWVILILLPQGYALVPVVKVHPGQPAALTCDFTESFPSVGWLHWYRQTPGDTLKLVAMLRKNTNPIYGPGFTSSYFNITYDEKMSNLTILKTAEEDEGMYHCVHVNLVESKWIGTYLSLKGERKTDYNVVHQPAVSHSALQGNSVSLQCSFLTDTDQKSCSREPTIFWIRSGVDESYPDIIYTNKKRSDHCEKRANMQRCLYNFSKKVSSSDTGTYYCAVATCRKILFGNAITPNIEATESSFQLLAIFPAILTTVLASSFIVLLVFLWFIIHKSKCQHCQAAVELQTPYDLSSHKTEEDRMLFSAAVFTLIKTVQTETKAPERRIFAAVEA